MDKFKGTPGPWSVNVIGPHWNNQSLTHIEVTFGEDGECICDTVYSPDDAQLIAAAPELLKALQGTLDIIKAGPNVNYLRRYGAVTRAKEAIAKALGK